MKIELWPVERLKPYPQHARINDPAVPAVKESLRQFGFRQPIVVDVDGVIICIERVRQELEGNTGLAADFPEVVYPARCLEGIHNRCQGQLHLGEPTRIVWTRRLLILPTIPGSLASSAAIVAAKGSSAARDLRFRRPDGELARPDLEVAVVG